MGASKLVLINYASTFIDVQQQPKDIRTEPIPHFPDGIKQFTSGKDYALNSAVRTQQWTTWRWPWPRVQNHFGKQAAGGTKGPFPPPTTPIATLSVCHYPPPLTASRLTAGHTGYMYSNIVSLLVALPRH